ncbi:GTPase-activating protein gyp8 [Recurvomyces mirabilis]|uniref:GTPase-activating protein gyp8 n=1 Tax=Recurvomyces mirabilis TaxID=574656 RepID=A0AAE0TQS1_9PEZI|nr:GTPase-activating protein gyp8 [Recurvomyces mirabilis]KAK5156236.1 GTPase-activating protein gyp8 [Recurvomyces mirabilis]
MSLPPLSASWRDEPLTRDERDKVQNILQACKDRDRKTLCELAATNDGLVEDEVRRIAWPILLSCEGAGDIALPDTKAAVHRDEDQVQLDVNRSFVYYPAGEPEKTKDNRKGELSHVITTVLRAHPMLHYFQGYHDIVQVFLLVLGAEAAVPAVARLSLLRIRDFMLPTMSGTESHLHLLPAILYAADAELYHHLSQSQPFFALPAILTLYAHDIEEYGVIARLFDFLLASEAAVPVYLFATIVISRKRQLLEIEADEPDMLHVTLTRLPKPLDLDGLIQRTLTIFREHPPEGLPSRAWSRVSRYSVLKTTHDMQRLATQSLPEGEAMYTKHAEEIKRAEEWKRRRQRMQQIAKRYKRPSQLAGAAIMAVIIAYWFGSGSGQAVLQIVHRATRQANKLGVIDS